MVEKMERLVGQFREASRRHFEATMAGDSKVANRQARIVHKSFLELREIGVEAREALLQVAIQGEGAEASMAAAYSLKYDPNRALAVLDRLSRDRGLVGFMAAQTIKRWKGGEWQLE